MLPIHIYKKTQRDDAIVMIMFLAFVNLFQEMTPILATQPINSLFFVWECTLLNLCPHELLGGRPDVVCELIKLNDLLCMHIV